MSLYNFSKRNGFWSYSINKIKIFTLTNAFDNETGKLIPKLDNKFRIADRYKHVYVGRFYEKGCLLSGVTNNEITVIGDITIKNHECDGQIAKYMSYPYYMSYNDLNKYFMVSDDYNAIADILGYYSHEALVSNLFTNFSANLDNATNSSFLHKDAITEVGVSNGELFKKYTKFTEIMGEKPATSRIWLNHVYFTSYISNWKF
jgi:hypothetical protein